MQTEEMRLPARFLPVRAVVRVQSVLEAAGAALGHSKMSATEVDTEKNLPPVLRVAAEMG